jgi:hypothetical protein
MVGDQTDTRSVLVDELDIIDRNPGNQPVTDSEAGKSAVTVEATLIGTEPA